jgi:hypothetical protein
MIKKERLCLVFRVKMAGDKELNAIDGMSKALYYCYWCDLLYEVQLQILFIIRLDGIDIFPF